MRAGSRLSIVAALSQTAVTLAVVACVTYLGAVHTLDSTTLSAIFGAVVGLSPVHAATVRAALAEERNGSAP